MHVVMIISESEMDVKCYVIISESLMLWKWFVWFNFDAAKYVDDVGYVDVCDGNVHSQ
jgi:hypothetical protein